LIGCPQGEGVIPAGVDHDPPTAQVDGVVDGPLTEDASGQNRRRELAINDEAQRSLWCSLEARREIPDALRHVP
jgi:hypothetical protein